MDLLIFLAKVIGIIALVAAIEVLPSYLSAKKRTASHSFSINNLKE